ncbi:HD family phosphohydrolase [Clostridium kluyveri]|uniref:HD family phosphohydrolase n=1 Tax=Clostridium kluyveri TaxID=1534 RepID=A0A1L5F339_CLOKL|nr:HD family phosphohydrolase [Clostridium kluyveri]
MTSKVNENDIKFVTNILNVKELELFNKLSIQEQKHSIKVAYDIKFFCKENNEIDMDLLLKAALLHDIGKIYRKLNLIDKSIIVLLNSISKGKIKSFFKNEKINVYYNHGRIGRELLERIKCDKKLLYLVEHHHNFEIYNNLELNTLRFYDKKN